MSEATHRRNLDGNLAALNRHLGDMERAGALLDMQTQIEDWILGASPADHADLCDPEELTEMAEAIKAHREAKHRGTAYDFQPDGCFWEHVHGVTRW